jgi:hypothetical protein
MPAENRAQPGAFMCAINEENRHHKPTKLKRRFNKTGSRQEDRR